MKKVAILMGSDSDLPIVEKGIAVLKDYGIPHEVHVYSAHRTPAETAEFVSAAADNDFGVIIAAAGMAAHLAGAVGRGHIALHGYSLQYWFRLCRFDWKRSFRADFSGILPD